MAKPPVLRGKHVTLRPFKPDDILDRYNCGRNAEYVEMMGADSQALPPLGLTEVKSWYTQMSRQPNCWAIEAEKACIGTARIHGIDEAHLRGRYAIGIFDPSAWGLGLGTEATRMVMRYAFETLRLHRVDLRVLAFNDRAIACYAKSGFSIEGYERESAWIDGAWHDDVIMSTLDREYIMLVKRWRLKK